jgi:hypothetical protein
MNEPRPSLQDQCPPSHFVTRDCDSCDMAVSVSLNAELPRCKRAMIRHEPVRALSSVRPCSWDMNSFTLPSCIASNVTLRPQASHIFPIFLPKHTPHLTTCPNPWHSCHHSVFPPTSRQINTNAWESILDMQRERDRERGYG